MDYSPEGSNDQEQPLPKEELVKETRLLYDWYEQTLSAIPEFREAAVAAYWRKNNNLYFIKDNYHYNVRLNSDPYSIHLYAARRTADDPKVDREVNIRLLTGGHQAEVWCWFSDWKDPKDLPFAPHYAKNSRKAIDGCNRFLREAIGL